MFRSEIILKHKMYVCYLVEALTVDWISVWIYDLSIIWVNFAGYL